MPQPKAKSNIIPIGCGPPPADDEFDAALLTLSIGVDLARGIIARARIYGNRKAYIQAMRMLRAAMTPEH